MKKSMDRSFWDQQHVISNQTWLTGSTLESYRGFFQINDDLSKLRILEVGVGLCRASRELARASKEFYCADISQAALDKLSDCTDHRFLTSDINSAPESDLVICHLVMVHCQDHEVVRILNDINLARDGKILVQFSGPSNDGEISERARQQFVDDNSHHFRTRQQIQDLVAQTNKRIDRMLPPVRVHHDGWFDHDWHPVLLANR